MAELLNPGENKRFNYTGNVQSIELLPGKYKLECYGASGGIGYGNINPIGKGGYISGELLITAITMLYIHVGQDGISNAMTSIRYNGGGAAVSTSGHNGGAGGGATDIRILPGTWNNIESLKSRILVAGGGGGAQPSCGATATAGHGGNLIGGTSYNQGYQGRIPSVAATRAYSTGGTQNSGGIGYNINDNQTSLKASGNFGSGASSVQCGAGGGGGWYGGGTAYTSGGGGGSSYAAGYIDCDKTYQAKQNYIILQNVEFKQGVNSGNGYAIITLIEIFNTHTVTVVNGNLVLNKKYVQTEKVDISYQKYIDASKTFSHWYSDDSNIDFNNYYDKVTYFIMPDNDVIVEAILKDNRLNSNIYKNIFPEEVINMDFINKSLANTIISTEDIRQDNHGLSVNDFVYLDDNGLYKKALAEESTRANVVGIVSKVAGPNVFTLMDSGTVSFNHLDYNDTTILYLSDKIPGKAVHYSEITNTVYIPVAVYIEDKIIIHLQQGSIGDVLVPYEKEEQNFENYTEQELNDVVNQITNGVK